MSTLYASSECLIAWNSILGCGRQQCAFHTCPGARRIAQQLTSTTGIWVRSATCRRMRRSWRPRWLPRWPRCPASPSCCGSCWSATPADGPPSRKCCSGARLSRSGGLATDQRGAVVPQLTQRSKGQQNSTRGDDQEPYTLATAPGACSAVCPSSVVHRRSPEQDIDDAHSAALVVRVSDQVHVKAEQPPSRAACLDATHVRRLDALAKGTKGASKWWLPYERPMAADADRITDRPSSTPSAVVTPGGRSGGGGDSGRRSSYDADEPPSVRSAASRSALPASGLRCLYWDDKSSHAVRGPCVEAACADLEKQRNPSLLSATRIILPTAKWLQPVHCILHGSVHRRHVKMAPGHSQGFVPAPSARRQAFVSQGCARPCAGVRSGRQLPHLRVLPLGHLARAAGRAVPGLRGRAPRARRSGQAPHQPRAAAVQPAVCGCPQPQLRFAAVSPRPIPSPNADVLPLRYLLPFSLAAAPNPCKSDAACIGVICWLRLYLRQVFVFLASRRRAFHRVCHGLRRPGGAAGVAGALAQPPQQFRRASPWQASPPSEGAPLSA